MARKLTDTVKLQLRFSESLRRLLEREAARNNRSMNTEIVHRLQLSIHKSQDSMTELAKMALDSLPNDARDRVIQLIGEETKRLVERRMATHDVRKDERKAGGKS
jgi:hypothetical protein